MRPSTPHVPPRGQAATTTAAPAEETKAAAMGADAGRRPRVDSSGRRSAAVQTLLGAVARAIFDEEEVVESALGHARAEEATDQATQGAMPGTAGVAPVTPRPRRMARAGTKSTVTSASARGTGEVAPDRDLWSADVTNVEGPWAVAQTDADERIAGRLAGKRAARRRIDGIGFSAGLMRPGVWGALLAAVAALVLLTVGGGFDLGDRPDEQGGRQAPAMKAGATADR